MQRTTFGMCMLLLTVGCGGGGGSVLAPVPPAPPLEVSAGQDLTPPFAEAATLSATISDSTATVAWTQVSGPGTAVFENPSLASTRAAFSAAGQYALQVSADDGRGPVIDEVLVTVGAPSGPLLVVDGNTTYQLMKGWEATTFAGQDASGFDTFKSAIFDAAVDDLGINRVRLEVRSGAENTEDFWTQSENGTITAAAWRSRRYSTVNDNADANVINAAGFQWSELDDNVDRIVTPLKTRIEANGEQLWINLCYVAFTSQIGFDGTTGLQYIHDDPNEYAELVEATYLHLDATYGWVPDSWEILLEPDNVSEWDGTTIGNAIVAAAARLQSHGYTPRFVAPSNTDMSKAITYYDDLLAVPGAIDFVTELSYHRYGGVSDANLQAIHSRIQTAGIESSHLEWIGATYNELHKDLTIAGNSSWAQFVLATTGADDGGGYYVVAGADTATPTVTLGSRTRYLRQYFKYVRRGARRLGITASGVFDPIVFRNTDARMVVVVKTTGGGDFNVMGLDAGTYGIKYTTAAQYDIDLPDVQIIAGQAVHALMPAAGVITIHAR